MDHCEKKKRKRNPRETANIFSLLSFAYTGSLFYKAYKNHDLEEDDLYEVLKSCNSKKCGDLIEKQWTIENKKEVSPSIYKLMWARFGWRYILRGTVYLCWKIGNSIIEPWAISNLISYFKPGQEEVSKKEAYSYAALVLIIHTIYTIFIHNYVIWVQQLGIEIKTAFSSLLYRKALRLTPSAVSEISLGNIVTLITRDVHAFEQSIWFINDMWIGIVQTSIICYLLYAKMGLVSFIGIGILLSVIPLQILIGKYVSVLRLATSKKTDQRLQIIQETLSTIRIIKMYNWERYFEEKINVARLSEINRMLLGYYLKIVIVLIGLLFSKIGFYILIMSYIWMGYTAEAELVFYVLAIFRDLRHTLGMVIPHGIGRGAELYSSIVRINKVIKGEELPSKSGSDDPTPKPLVEIKEATVHILNKVILKDITYSTECGLTVVTGTVGSGKSSLLKTILQDYPLTSGQLVTYGRISYASQDPWLFPSSIKQNILFGEEFKEKRYKEVIRVCALQYDFDLLDKGDETIVTDRGLNLSKGQQARVNLARAIYKDSEIYLIDDALTALDAHVQDYIFNEGIKNFLKDKICILVSQNTSHVQEADFVIIMEANQAKYYGKPSENVLNKISELIIVDDDLEKEVIEEFEGKHINDKPENAFIETEQVTRKPVYREVNKKGEVDFGIYKKYVVFGGGYFLLLLILILFGIAQGTESYSDKLLTKWVDDQQKVLDMRKNFTEVFEMSDLSNSSLLGTANYEEAVSKEQFSIRLYSVMILVSTVFALIKIYAIFDFCRRASIKIHQTMVRIIMEAVMAFFDTHFIGNILNRFSQDFTNTDEHLLHILTEFLKMMFAITGVLFLLAFVNLYFLLFASVFFAFLIVIRKLYLPAGRSLKRLEAATRSPMIGHLNASLEGLTTIRAYKAQNILIEEFDKHQDVYTSAHYTSICSMRAFGFIMDFLCSIFVMLIVSRLLLIDTDTSAGNVGLALTQALMLASLVQWGVRTWADLENLMTSVERLLEYTEIPSENQEGSEVANWPSRGSVTYQNVSLTYNNSETVLKNLNFKVEALQKIGIVGRTGAGKSSIISSIFRLYSVEGKILIDDVDISTLSLKFLRKRIAIIPQDPVLFSGTIRTNLDPFGEYQDVLLWKVLEEVNIRRAVPSLEMEISSTGGSNFSSGQKQLLCLARAILRETRIVILDEATANMDHDTDTLLHNTISTNFEQCTVLVIAHRLHSILACDKVMVLDRGEIKEFDDPVVLLENREGLFYKMCSGTGRNGKLDTLLQLWSNRDNKTRCYYYAFIVLFINIAESIFYHNYDMVLITFALEAKTGFSSFLYRKSLKLSPESISDISLGNLLTLITKDVHTFVSFSFVVNDMWIGAIQSALICYLIYTRIGAVSLIGIAVLMSALPIEFFLGRWIKKLRLEASAKTDERLQTTQEVISTIRMIKMLTWEDHFTKKINLARKKEMAKTLTFYLRYVLIAIGLLFSKISFYVLLMAYIWMGYSSDTSLVFYMLSVTKEMRHFFGELVPIGFGTAGELSASLTRIRGVMIAEELPKKTAEVSANTSSIQLERATLRFGNEYILRDITLDIKPGLTIVTGPLASGKSSLLKVILRDYPLTMGELTTTGRVSYASQDPWLFPSSIKQNILFGQNLDETRYHNVIRACALDFDLNLFERGDETIVNDKGMNLSKGQQARINLARALYKESEIYLLDDSLATLDPHVKDHIYNAGIKTYLQGKVCILVSQSARHIQNADYLVMMDKGEIQYFGKPLGDVLEEISVEDEDDGHMADDISNGKHFEMPVNLSKIKVYDEVNRAGNVEYSVYPKYVVFGGGFLILLINLILFGITQTAESYTDQLLTKWVDEKQLVLNMVTDFTKKSNITSIEDLYEKKDFTEAELLEKETFNIYTMMMVVTTGLALVKTYAFLDFSRRASIDIHKAMIRNVVHAFMPFFDNNFIGIILNRFSKDLVNIDERLPFSISALIDNIFSIIGIIILIATVKPIFLIYVGVITVLLVITGIIYLPTGRSLKRLEASTQSPMIGHLNATLEGLTTIRAYDAEYILRNEFDKHQDLYTSAHFTSIVSVRAFGFIMDMMCAVFQIAVVSRFLLIDTDTSAGYVGLALTQVFMLGGIIQSGVRSFTELDNLMTSMERVLQYTSLQSEPVGGTTHGNWPEQGAITYDRVSLTYNNSEVVLRNLIFWIQPREKIGIVGRTGAGKSSMIASIFRLYEAEGNITIDGVNIKSVAITFLRRNLAIIPQDPVLFSGTLRANLDPLGEYRDEELWCVLEKVNMRTVVSDLNLSITSTSSVFSLGQKLLLCLARAILRKSKIVILDEASANMDRDTEVLLQQMIRDNFEDCTVFNIAHRLQSILWSDRVMVLERGEIEEFGAPKQLLRNRNGRFYKMVRQAGLLDQFNDG